MDVCVCVCVCVGESCCRFSKACKPQVYCGQPLVPLRKVAATVRTVEINCLNPSTGPQLP